jgi:hypothetical protein
MSDTGDEMGKANLNEPEVIYTSVRRFAAFSSFEEENEAQYLLWRKMTPTQRLEQHLRLSLVVFANYPKYNGNRLTFD